jgi:hypothetical protein
MINRSLIADTLGSIDPAYKKHANVVTSKANTELQNVFGFSIVTMDNIVGIREAKKHKDEHLLLSTVDSVKLRYLVAGADKGAPYYGFMLLVLYLIMTGPGQRLSLNGLYSGVRETDPRFPLELDHNYNSTGALAVPELGDHFLGLIDKMKKVCWLYIAHRTHCFYHGMLPMECYPPPPPSLPFLPISYFPLFHSIPFPSLVFRKVIYFA